MVSITECESVRILNYLDQCMKDADEAKVSLGEAQPELLDEVDQTETKLFQAAGLQSSCATNHWTAIGAGTGDENGFLAFAAK